MPGWDEHLHPGHPNGDPFEMPADLAAVQADDALLDMIGAGHTPCDADDELTRVLAAWRLEVHTEPATELVDTSTALALIRAAARRPTRRRSPVFGSIAGAAAVVVIAFSSVGLVAKSAEPGDPLWGVTEVLYSEYAESVETAAAVRTDLQQANKALEQGNRQQAREALQRIRQQLPAVGESEGRTELTTAQQKLEEQLNPTSTPPSMDLPARTGVTPPGPAGAAPEAGAPAQPTMPKPDTTNTAPDSRRELPDRPSHTDADQFFPGDPRDPRDPRTYYPSYPDGTDHPYSRPQGGDPTRTDRTGDDTTTDDRKTDDSTTETETRDDDNPPPPPPPPSPMPSPSSPPDTGSTIGAGPSPGQVDAPASSSSDIPLVSAPNPEQVNSPEQLNVAEADQPSFSASTASV